MEKKKKKTKYQPLDISMTVVQVGNDELNVFFLFIKRKFFGMTIHLELTNT